MSDEIDELRERVERLEDEHDIDHDDEQPTKTFRGNYEADLVFEDSYVKIYEDNQGDYWLDHTDNVHERIGVTHANGTLHAAISELIDNE